MSLAIPNTTTADAYTAATTFPPEQGAGTPFASGYLVIANNPATVSVLRGRTQGAASWGADFSYAPTTLPISSGLDPATGQIRDYIFGVRFKNAVPGSNAQVFGGLFQLGDVTLSPANQFTGTLGSGGSFTPPAPTNVISGAILAGGGIFYGTGFTVAHPGPGVYTITYTTPYPAYSVANATPIALSVSGQDTFVGYSAISGAAVTLEFRNAAGVLTDIGFVFAINGA